jgi:leader peptidase (prepilin peptidase) / N-methyltransferase
MRIGPSPWPPALRRRALPSDGNSGASAAAVSTPVVARPVWFHVAVAAVAAAVSALAFARFGLEPRAFVAAYFAAVLIVLSAIDIDRRVIPNRIVLPSTAVVLAAQIAFYPGQAAEWLLAAAAVAFVMSVPGLISPGSIGMGDAKLAMLIGAALGQDVAMAIMLGFVLSLPVALALLARGGQAARKQHIPLGPFLALGALVVLFASGA